MADDLSEHSYHLDADFLRHSFAQRMESVLIPHETL